MKKSLYISFLFLVGVQIVANAQTSNSSGAWSVGTNWVGNTAPNNGNLGADVIVKDVMTFASNTSFTGWGATTITINNGGTIKVTGNMDMQGSGISIIIKSGGTLDVSGTLSVNNQSQITMNNGSTLKAGSLTMTDNASSKLNYTGGTISLTGNLYVGAAETFSYTPAIAIPGNVTILQGASITASSLGGNITLSGSSKLTLSTGGTVQPTTINYSGSNCEIVVSSGTLKYTSALSITSNKLTINGGAANLAALSVNSATTVAVASGASLTATSLTTSSNSDALYNNYGTTTINGNVSSSGIITNYSGATMQINGSLTQNNSGNGFYSYGNVNVTGAATANGLIQLYPGTSANSEFVVSGNMTVNSNPWLLVGTDVSSCGSAITYYADAVIKGNLVLTGSGYVVVKQNGRLVVFGNFDGTGGTGNNQLVLNCGAQTYVNGKVDLTTGGGSAVTNSNSASSPTGTDGTPRVGLYVNGTTTAQNKTGTIDNKAQLKTNDKPFYDYIASLSGSPLPITLVSFKAALAKDAVNLSWSTSFEKNFDKFVVERSNDGKKFEAIGEVKGVGNTTIIQNYSLDDNSPVNGVNYYRLKSVDLDYSYEYSKVIYVEYEGDKSFSIYPNPSTGESVYFTTNMEESDSDAAIVINYIGTIVSTATINHNTKEIVFNTPLKQGTYLLKYTAGSFQRVERLAVK